MKKIFFSIFSFLLILTVIAIFYLSTFGYETNRFNDTITKIIKQNDKNIDINFEKVKISLEIKNLSIFVKLTKPKLYYFETLIPLQSLKADINLFSLFSNKNSIKQIIVHTKYINFKSIKPIIARLKPGNFKTILLNNVNDSKFKINSELKFDDNLKVKENSSFSGDVKETLVNIKNKYSVKDISFDFVYNDKLLNMTNVKAKLEDLEIFESQINYNHNNDEHKIDGKISGLIDSYGNNIEKIFSLVGINVENFSFISFKGTASTSFDLQLDETLAVKKRKFISSFTVDELKANLKNKISSEFLTEDIKNIHIKDTIINLDQEKKKTLTKITSLIKITDEFFKLDILKKEPPNSTSFSIEGKSPIKIPIINYSFKTGKSFLKGQYVARKDKGIFFPSIKYEINKDTFEIKNLALSKDFDLINFKKAEVITKFDGNTNNNFTILNSGKNKILIRGTTFDSKLLAKKFSKKNKNNFLKNISSGIEVDFDKILTDTDFPLKKFRLIGNIKKGKFEKISGKSEFLEGKYLDISLKKENNSNFKILEIHSDVARPLLNSYKFFDGLNQGNLIYESKFDDKNSTAILKVNDFKLIEAPAFAKLLTLADFQGLTDTLKGEGISFDTLVIKYTTDPKIMKIQEIFMIGPSISILIDGYVEQESGLVSLRGTLVPAKTLNTLLSKIPLVGTILIGKKDGEGLFGVSFKIKGLPNELKTTVNPVKTLTPRFITRALEALKKQQIK